MKCEDACEVSSCYINLLIIGHNHPLKARKLSLFSQKVHPDNDKDGNFVSPTGRATSCTVCNPRVFVGSVCRKMAAKLANQGGARSTGERQETVLCQSYASVVNPKSASQTRASSFKGNNKENIDDQATASQQAPQSQQQQLTTVVKERIVPSMVRGKPYQRIVQCQSTQPNQFVSSSHPTKHNRHDSPSNTYINAQKSVAIVHKEVLSESHQEDSHCNRDAEQLNNCDIGNDGEFQTVAPKGARRKEKMREQNHRERHRLRENNRHQQPRGSNGAGSGGIVRRGSVERSYRERSDRNGVTDYSLKEAHHHKDEQNVDAEVQSVCSSSPVKYVEAPLPAVNPWTKNKALTSQIASTSSQQTSCTALTTLASTDRQSEREKRVLQPQQQHHTTGKLNYILSIVS